MAQTADTKREIAAKKRATQLKLTFSGAILASLIAVSAVVWPQVMSNQALAQINAAMARVSSVQMTTFRLKDGKRITQNQTYFQNGQWRVENPENGFTTLYKGGKRWIYNARAGRVTVQRGVKGAFGWNASGFTLADMMRDFGAQGDKTSLKIQGYDTLRGRKIKRALLEIKNKRETLQWLLMVDDETDLPLRGEMKMRAPYGKTEIWITEMSYNRPVSAKLFEPKFARTAKFIDLGRRDADLKTKMAGGLAKKRVGERIVAIRELQVNRNGDVFLLYTAGKRLGKTTGDGFRSNNWFAGRDWKVFLTDSLGTRYHYMRNDFQFSLYPVEVQGQRLEGDWWVPATATQPGQKWKPRTFFLNFEMSPKNLHGTFKQTFQINYSARARFEIPVDEAENSVMPSLAQSLQTGLSEESIVKQASEERGELPPGALPSPQLVRELPEIGTFSPDSTQIATGIVGEVRIVSAQSGAQTKVLRVPAAFSKMKVGAPLISADGQILCAAAAFDSSPDSDAQQFTWNLASGRLLGSWRSNKVRDVLLLSSQLSPDGTRLRRASSIITKRVGEGKQQWVETGNLIAEERDVLTGKVTFSSVLKHDGFVLSVEQGTTKLTDWMIVTSQKDKAERGLVRAWNARSGALLKTFENRSQFGTSRLKLAGRVPTLAVGVQYFELKNRVHEMGESEIRLFDVATGELRRAISVERVNGAGILALSDDGKWLATREEDNKIAIWSAQTGRLEQSLTGHGTYAYRFEFSADGKWLQSVDAKEKVLLWKLD
ncbi:MAG TPA: WD40 repeat domain-containing protein [Abditibacterium sp.]